ncbi:DedA family protein [Streptacidiphilus monticola]|jgi:membrane protein DedA with SNARE-associated domain|uniref:DedA family protein n=1 Tax=Streptacidiphilus monticola TaxID=2161674 RepID=A0ABW1FVT8_9ACTN
MSQLVALFAGSWFFLLTLLAVASDAFLPFVPSGTMVIAATLEAEDTHTPLLLLGAGVAAASFAGDLLLLRVARRGRAWTRRLLARKAGTAAATESILDSVRTRRARTVVIARFVPGGRTILDLAVGTAQQPPRRFLRWSAVSATVWAVYIVGLGYLNEHAFNTNWLSFAISCAATTAVSAIIAQVIRRRRKAAAVAAP